MSESREMKIGRLCPAAGPAVLLITLILTLFPLTLIGSRAVFAENSSALEQRVRSILESYRQEPENWGILVRSLERGDDLLRLNATRRYMPVVAISTG